MLWEGCLKKSPPPLTRPLDVVKRNRKMCSEARQKSFQKYFGQFFDKVNVEVILINVEVNIDVYKCHIKQNSVFLQKSGITSNNFR